jgi:hypothetical protein
MLLLYWVVSYAMFAGFGVVILILCVNNLIAQQSKLFTNKYEHILLPLTLLMTLSLSFSLSPSLSLSTSLSLSLSLDPSMLE